MTLFGTKFSWNEGTDTWVNVECVLLCRNFDFLAGYLVVNARYLVVTVRYSSLMVLTACYHSLLLVPTFSMKGRSIFLPVSKFKAYDFMSIITSTQHFHQYPSQVGFNIAGSIFVRLLFETTYEHFCFSSLSCRNLSFKLGLLFWYSASFDVSMTHIVLLYSFGDKIW